MELRRRPHDGGPGAGPASRFLRPGRGRAQGACASSAPPSRKFESNGEKRRYNLVRCALTATRTPSRDSRKECWRRGRRGPTDRQRPGHCGIGVSDGRAVDCARSTDAGCWRRGRSFSPWACSPSCGSSRASSDPLTEAATGISCIWGAARCPSARCHRPSPSRKSNASQRPPTPCETAVVHRDGGGR